MTYGKNLVRNLELYCDADASAIPPRFVYGGTDMRGLCERALRRQTGEEMEVHLRRQITDQGNDKRQIANAARKIHIENNPAVELNRIIV